jgi:hypothetical protein
VKNLPSVGWTPNSGQKLAVTSPVRSSWAASPVPKTNSVSYCAAISDALRDTFGESGTPEELAVRYGLTAADIAVAVAEALARKKR